MGIDWDSLGSPITHKQLARMVILCERHRMTREDIDLMLKVYGYTSRAHVNSWDYEAIISDISFYRYERDGD